MIYLPYSEVAAAICGSMLKINNNNINMFVYNVYGWVLKLGSLFLIYQINKNVHHR